MVAQLRNDARDFVVIDRLKEPVRLRMGLDDTRRLSPEAQARALGEALAASGLTPGRIVCGPLKRTRRATDIAL